MHSYCSNNAVTVLNAAKSLKIQSIINFKNLSFTRILSASQPAIRPSFASATAVEFLHNKGNHVRFTKQEPIFSPNSMRWVSRDSNVTSPFSSLWVGMHCDGCAHNECI